MSLGSLETTLSTESAMATKSPMNARPEKKQLIIIAIILVLGAVGGALILRGGESHGDRKSVV